MQKNSESFSKLSLEEQTIVKGIIYHILRKKKELKDGKNIDNKKVENDNLIIEQLNKFKQFCGSSLIPEVIDFTAIADYINSNQIDYTEYQKIYFDSFFMLFEGLFNVAMNEKKIIISAINSPSTVSSYLAKILKSSADDNNIPQEWEIWKQQQITDIYCLNIKLPTNTPAERLAQRILKQFILKKRRQKVLFCSTPLIRGNQTSIKSHELPSLLSSHAEIVKKLEKILNEFTMMPDLEQIIALPTVGSIIWGTLDAYKVEWNKLYRQIEPCLKTENNQIICQEVTPQQKENWSTWISKEIAERKLKDQHEDALTNNNRLNPEALVRRAAFGNTLNYYEKDTYLLTEGDIQGAFELLLGKEIYNQCFSRALWTPQGFASAFNRQWECYKKLLADNPDLKTKKIKCYIWGNDAGHWIWTELEINFSFETRKNDENDQIVFVDKDTKIHATFFDTLNNSSRQGRAKALKALLHNHEQLKGYDQKHQKNEYQNYCDIPQSNITVSALTDDEYIAQPNGWECGFFLIFGVLRRYWQNLDSTKQQQFEQNFLKQIPKEFADPILTIIKQPLSQPIKSAEALYLIRNLLLSCTELSELPAKQMRGLSAEQQKQTQDEIAKKFERNENKKTFKLKSEIAKDFLEKTLPPHTSQSNKSKNFNTSKQNTTTTKGNNGQQKNSIALPKSKEYLKKERQKKYNQFLSDSNETVEAYCVDCTVNKEKTNGKLHKKIKINIKDLFLILNQLSLKNNEEKALAKKALLKNVANYLVKVKVNKVIMQSSFGADFSLDKKLSETFIRFFENHFDYLPKIEFTFIPPLTRIKIELSDQAYQKFFQPYVDTTNKEYQEVIKLIIKVIKENESIVSKVANKQISLYQGFNSLTSKIPNLQKNYYFPIENIFKTLIVIKQYFDNSSIPADLEQVLKLSENFYQTYMQSDALKQFFQNNKEKLNNLADTKLTKGLFFQLLEQFFPGCGWQENENIFLDYNAHPKIMALKRAYEYNLIAVAEKKHSQNLDENINSYKEIIVSQLQQKNFSTLEIDFEQLFKWAIIGKESVEADKQDLSSYNLSLAEKKLIILKFWEKLKISIQNQLQLSFNIEKQLKSLENRKQTLLKQSEENSQNKEIIEKIRLDLFSTQYAMAFFVYQWNKTKTNHQTLKENICKYLQTCQSSPILKINIYDLWAHSIACDRFAGYLLEDFDKALILKKLDEILAEKNITKIIFVDASDFRSNLLRFYWQGLLENISSIEECQYEFSDKKYQKFDNNIRIQMTNAIVQRKINQNKNQKEQNEIIQPLENSLSILQACRNFLQSYNIDDTILKSHKINLWDIVIELLCRDWINDCDATEVNGKLGWHLNLSAKNTVDEISNKKDEKAEEKVEQTARNQQQKFIIQMMP